MNHWHKCERWTKRGLPCPFSSLGAEHEKIEDREEEDIEIPSVEVALPAKAEEPRGRGRRREGLLSGAADVPSVEDMVEEVLDALPDDPEPVVPPGRAPVRPVIPGPVPFPVIPPIPNPRPVGVPAMAQASARAVNYMYRRPERVETVYARSAAARSEEIVAQAFAGPDPVVSKFQRDLRAPKRRRPRGGARGGSGRGRGRGTSRPGGFFFNATAAMEQMFGIGGGGPW